MPGGSGLSVPTGHEVCRLGRQGPLIGSREAKRGMLLTGST